MSIFWFFGPKESIWNGVGQYSKLLCDELTTSYEMKINQQSIPYHSRSLKRYIYQFLVYPFLLLKNINQYQLVVLYQEDLAFLIPFAKLLRKRVFVIYHHLPTQTASETLFEKIKLLYLKITANLISYADKVICPSQQSVNAVSNQLNINISKFSVVYNAFEKIDCDAEENKSTFFNRLGVLVGEDEFIFLNVGTDETRKNLLVFIESLSLVKNVKVHFIRVGKSLIEENKNIMQDVINKNDIRVSFLEFLSDEDLAALYHFSDVYVSPSVHEGFGRTVIEAQLAATPVLASKIAVYDEIMGSSYFSVINFKDRYEWASAIESISEKKDELILDGIENSKRFTRKNVAVQFTDLLKGFN